MPSRCCEFVDSRLRRSPPDRASAVPYGQAGENAMRFPTLPTGRRLPTSFTARHNDTGMILFRGMFKPAAGYPPLAYSSPEPVQTTGTVALNAIAILSASGHLHPYAASSPIGCRAPIPAFDYPH